AGHLSGVVEAMQAGGGLVGANDLLVRFDHDAVARRAEDRLEPLPTASGHRPPLGQASAEGAQFLQQFLPGFVLVAHRLAPESLPRELRRMIMTGTDRSIQKICPRRRAAPATGAALP